MGHVDPLTPEEFEAILTLSEPTVEVYVGEDNGVAVYEIRNEVTNEVIGEIGLVAEDATE